MGVGGGVCDGRRWGSGRVGEFKCILVHFEPESSVKKKIKKVSFMESFFYNTTLNTKQTRA